MKKLSLIISLFLLSIVFSACTEVTGVNSSDNVSKIELKDNLLDLRLNKDVASYQVEVNVLPTSAINKKVTYESSTKAVFTVSETGLITPVKVGIAELIIKSTDGTKISRRYKVYIVDFITDFSFTNLVEGESLFTGDSMIVELGFTPANATIKEMTYSSPSSNANVLTIDKTGMIRINGVGEATITLKTTDGSGISKTLNLNVKEKVYITDLNIINAASPIKEFRTAEIAPNIAVLPLDASYAGRFNYVSMTPDVLAVNAKGIVTGLKVGTGKIKVSTKDGSNQSIEYPVTVTAGVTSISRTNWTGWAKSVYNADATRQVANAINGSSTSYFWHSKEAGASQMPQWYLVDMKTATTFYRMYTLRVTGTQPDLMGVEYYITNNVPVMTENGISLTQEDVKAFVELDPTKTNSTYNGYWKQVGSFDFGSATSGILNATINFPEPLTSRFILIWMPNSVRTNGACKISDFQIYTLN